MQILTTHNPTGLQQIHQYIQSDQLYDRKKANSLSFIYDPSIMQQVYALQFLTYPTQELQYIIIEATQ